MANTARVRAIDEPNLVLPLATSYNERGTDGYTHTVTNSEDQRKINFFYELVRNQVTGKGTLTLSKRPGVVAYAGVGDGTWGTSTQEVFLLVNGYISINIGKQIIAGYPPLIFHRDTSASLAVKVSNETTTTTIVTGATVLTPIYADRVAISGVDTIYVQIKVTGSPSQRVFYSSTIGTWTEIVDADFTSLNGFAQIGKMVSIDGFTFVMSQASVIWNSDSNSIANWTASSFLAKQIAQDQAVGLAKTPNNQLLAFGEETVEAFYNAGNSSGSPLGRIPQISTRIGMIVPLYDTNSTRAISDYYCTIGSRIYFIGRGGGGTKSAALYSYGNGTFEKISSPYLDKFLGSTITTSLYCGMSAVTVNGQSAVAIRLTDPNSGSTQRWIMFFPDWREWFEWTSDIFSPITSGEFFVGASSSLKNKLYTFDASDTYADAGTNYAHSTQFKLPSNGSSLNYLGLYGVDADTDTTTNNLTAEISTNDCASFSTLGTLDLTQDRKIIVGGGSFRKGHIRYSGTNARPVRLHNGLFGID